MKRKRAKAGTPNKPMITELTLEQWALVEKHLTRVRRFARFFRVEDATSVALLALIDAVATFIPDLMKDPEAHLVSWIRLKVRYALLSAIADDSSAPVTQAFWDFRGKYGRAPSVRELRRFSGCARVQVRRAWARLMAALDVEISNDELGNHECVAPGTVPSPSEATSLPKELLDGVWSVLAGIRARDAFLLALKFGLSYEDWEILEIIQCAQVLVDLGHDRNALSVRRLVPELPPGIKLRWGARLLKLKTLAGVRIALFRARKKFLAKYRKDYGNPFDESK